MRINAQRHESVPKDGDAGEQKPDQMHDMLPADAVLIAEVLLQLLELRQNVRIVGPVNMAGKEDMPRFDQLSGKRRAGLDERRIQALQNIRIRLQAEADEFFELPVAL